MEGISVSKLPETFRHALIITQALRYEYIWTDSLCILQSTILGKYHAGLWENSLPYTLLWRAGKCVLMADAHTYIGPTWSWVKVLSTRSLPYRTGETTKDVAKVIQFRTYLESSQRYDQICAAWIRLNSLLLRLSSVRADYE